MKTIFYYILLKVTFKNDFYMMENSIETELHGKQYFLPWYLNCHLEYQKVEVENAKRKKSSIKSRMILVLEKSLIYTKFYGEKVYTFYKSYLFPTIQ